MSTRGLIGFRYNDIDKLAYNSTDSQPDILGLKVLRDLKEVVDWSEVESRIGKLNAICETNRPGYNDGMLHAELRRHFPHVGFARNPLDYHELFQPLQGSLRPYLDGRLSHMPNANDFIYDSLHCEWAYIANMDDWQFEIWKGGQNKPDPENRYGQEADRMGHYPCKLIKTYELEDLPAPGRYLSDYFFHKELSEGKRHTL